MTLKDFSQWSNFCSFSLSSTPETAFPRVHRERGLSHSLGCGPHTRTRTLARAAESISERVSADRPSSSSLLLSALSACSPSLTWQLQLCGKFLSELSPPDVNNVCVYQHQPGERGQGQGGGLNSPGDKKREARMVLLRKFDSFPTADRRGDKARKADGTS